MSSPESILLCVMPPDFQRWHYGEAVKKRRSHCFESPLRRPECSYATEPPFRVSINQRLTSLSLSFLDSLTLLGRLRADHLWVFFDLGLQWL